MGPTTSGARPGPGGSSTGFFAALFDFGFNTVVCPIVLLIYLAFIRMTLEIYYPLVRLGQGSHGRLPR